MIGTGVFTTSGFALADLRDASFVMLAWLVGGLYAFSGVAIYSDLAKSYPESGGEYVFLKHLLHPALGTAAGWVSLVAGFTVPIAVAALGAELYLGRAFGLSLADPWIATAMILCLGLIHALAQNAARRPSAGDFTRLELGDAARRLAFRLFRLAADVILQPPARAPERIINGEGQVRVAFVLPRWRTDLDFETLRHRRWIISLP